MIPLEIGIYLVDIVKPWSGF